MRWLRSLLGGEQAEQVDPARREALLGEVRHRFGVRVRIPYSDQVDQVTRLLDGDDGLAVAAAVVSEVAEQAHANLLAQAAEVYRRTGYRMLVDRRNYRPLWRASGQQLRWPLFELPGGLHPYAQVTGAVRVLGAGAPRLVKTTTPEPLLAHLFEVLDLTTIGWEYAGIRADGDSAGLALRLIGATRDIRAEMGDPPPLPPCIREMMRRNHTVEVRDPSGTRVLGGINPGAEMRAALLA